MEEGRDGVIKEEQDEDAQSFTTTDSFADEPKRVEEEEEEEYEDYTSLAFERDLEANVNKMNRCRSSSGFLMRGKDRYRY